MLGHCIGCCWPNMNSFLNIECFTDSSKLIIPSVTFSGLGTVYLGLSRRFSACFNGGPVLKSWICRIGFYIRNTQYECHQFWRVDPKQVSAEVAKTWNDTLVDGVDQCHSDVFICQIKCFIWPTSTTNLQETVELCTLADHTWYIPCGSWGRLMCGQYCKWKCQYKVYPQ